MKLECTRNCRKEITLRFYGFTNWPIFCLMFIYNPIRFKQYKTKCCLLSIFICSLLCLCYQACTGELWTSSVFPILNPSSISLCWVNLSCWSWIGLSFDLGNASYIFQYLHLFWFLQFRFKSDSLLVWRIFSCYWTILLIIVNYLKWFLKLFCNWNIF